MTAPLCACGCGKPVKQRRDKSWCTYASLSCSGRVNGKKATLTPQAREANRVWRVSKQQARHGQLIEVLTQYHADAIEQSVVLELVTVLELRAYQRGFQTGRCVVKQTEAEDEYEPTLKDA